MIGRLLCWLGFHDWRCLFVSTSWDGTTRGIDECRRCRIRVTFVEPPKEST